MKTNSFMFVFYDYLVEKTKFFSAIIFNHYLLSEYQKIVRFGLYAHIFNNRGVFRTHSNIYDVAFSAKIVNGLKPFTKKAPS